MAYIELTNIGKSFADGRGSLRTVLSSLFLQVEKGEFVAVTGVSGSGKTTLLSIMGTLLQPDDGDYLIDGQRVDFADEAQLRSRRSREIGFMFQDHRLLPQLTAWQNILLPMLATRRQPTDDDRAWAEELVTLMGIGHVAHQLPETLSGGEKSRVGLCRALVTRPKLLLADEPTGQLDSSHAREVVELLCSVSHERLTTIVMATHDEELALKADCQYMLKEGRL